MCLWLMLGVGSVVYAENSFPKIAAIFDFNTAFSENRATGFRLQLFTDNMYFAKRKSYKWVRKTYQNTVAYSFGMGFGNYMVNSLRLQEGNSKNLYQVYTIHSLCYQSESLLEPFIGVYPGVTWGIKKDYFVNPTVGVNIATYRGYRDWVGKSYEVSGQVRIEYNTMLSSIFFGVGLVLKII